MFFKFSNDFAYILKFKKNIPMENHFYMIDVLVMKKYYSVLLKKYSSGKEIVQNREKIWY